MLQWLKGVLSEPEPVWKASYALFRAMNADNHIKNGILNVWEERHHCKKPSKFMLWLRRM